MAETTKPRTKRPVAKKPQTLAEIGRAAAEREQRAALLDALERNRWQLSTTAEQLGLVNASNVIRAIRRLHLDDEYEQARERGLVQVGRRA